MAWTFGHSLLLILAVVGGAAAGWALRGRQTAGRPSSGVDPVSTRPEPVHAQAEPVASPTEPADTRVEPVEAQREPVDAQTGPAAPQPGPGDGEPEPVTARTEPVTARTEPAPGTQPLPVPVAEATHAEPDTTGPTAAVPAAADRAEPTTGPADPVDDQNQPVQPAADGSGPAGADAADGQHDPVVPTPRDAEDGPDDDFRRIQGIGPKIAAALQAAGIRTYRQLAEHDEAGLREVIRGAGLRAAPGLASWPQQARILADAPAAEADRVFPAPTA